MHNVWLAKGQKTTLEKSRSHSTSTLVTPIIGNRKNPLVVVTLVTTIRTLIAATARQKFRWVRVVMVTLVYISY